jgi:hypothetical protein
MQAMTMEVLISAVSQYARAMPGLGVEPLPAMKARRIPEAKQTLRKDRQQGRSCSGGGMVEGKGGAYNRPKVKTM